MLTTEQTETQLWEPLVSSIRARNCIIFLGAGVAVPHLPSGASLSRDLAKEMLYPFNDVDNLPRVAQYVATSRNSDSYVRRWIAERLADQVQTYLDKNDGRPPPNYRMLASFNGPLYLTTNYDRFMQLALEQASRNPVNDICRWTEEIAATLKPHPRSSEIKDRPIVYYLHGALEKPDTILVTEDDYVAFMVNLALQSPESKHSDMIWHEVYRRLSTLDVLFVGYSLRDWNFRVLLRELLTRYRVVSKKLRVSIQLQELDDREGESREDRAARELRAAGFVEQYFQLSNIQLHWHPANVFLEDLVGRLASTRQQ